MKTIEETQSKWKCVYEEIEKSPPLKLGYYCAHWFRNTPRRLLHCISYYKFAAKMIGAGKSVLDVGCNEGLGSWLIAKECGYCCGLDFDEAALKTAWENYTDPSIAFVQADFLQFNREKKWDAVINFDVIEHIYPEHASLFFSKMASSLVSDGIAVIGTPSLISDQFANPHTRAGHVNLYSHDRLQKELREHFEFVFLFSANDEIVHTGFYPLAHYFIALCCKPKK